uniref:Uncharacterized protein n=1 Tax=viral metagenome TaxID=1070528 RepID=A0A6C0CK24_9ZZZZ
MTSNAVWANIVKKTPTETIKTDIKKVENLTKDRPQGRQILNWTSNAKKWKALTQNQLGLREVISPRPVDKFTNNYRLYRPHDPVFHETYYDILSKKEMLEEYLEEYPDDNVAGKEYHYNCRLINDYVWLD